MGRDIENPQRLSKIEPELMKLKIQVGDAID
jgi:hypothetical protein